MIISKLTGGLGNQMFQYAAGLALAHKHRTALKLDTGWFPVNAARSGVRHYAYALHCFNVLEQFATQEEINGLIGQSGGLFEKVAYRAATILGLHRLSRVLGPSVGQLHNQESAKFYPSFLDLPDNTYLSGTFQSEKFFLPVAEQLRPQFSFRYPLSSEVAGLAREIKETESISVHFRWGDYVSDARYRESLGVLPMGYYRDAVALLRQKLGTAIKLYVFSDDIDAVEKEFLPDAPRTYVRGVRPENSHDELRLMALCRHNVIANSTFSWWAAWLNANSAKVVIAPDPFFQGLGADGADVVPESWVKLPVAPAQPVKTRLGQAVDA
jgi:Glycosyl transferase family 11